MKKTSLAVVGVLVVLLGGFVLAALSFRNQAITMEKGIEAQYTQNQNNYDNYWKRVKEMAQVPDQYAEKLKELYDSAIGARYGEEGSGAMFQWLQEQNPNLDPSVYTKIQTTIEAGRTAFAADQTQLIDKKREYETMLDSNRGMMLKWVFGLPRINLDDYDIVTSDATQEAFDTKKADEVNVFGN